MKYYTIIDGVEREYRFERRGGELLAVCGDRTLVIDVSMVGDGSAFSMLVDGVSHDLLIERRDGTSFVQCRGERFEVSVFDELEKAARSVADARPAGEQEVCAGMPGVVADILVNEGEVVEQGQTLLILEAMKMQNPVKADSPGVVVRVLTEKGAVVANGALLVEIDCGGGG